MELNTPKLAEVDGSCAVHGCPALAYIVCG